MPDEGAWYHGMTRRAGGSPVVIEDAEGHPAGVLAHVIWHSPGGFAWGSPGPAAADLSRSLLIAALGDTAKCPVCGGTGRLVWDENGERAFDPGRGAGLLNGEATGACYRCHDGWSADLPYQRFTFAVVAHWPRGRDWRISRAQVLQWLAAQPDSGVRDV